jgi:hypothetical protein
MPLLGGTTDQAEVGIEEIIALQSFKRFGQGAAAPPDDLEDGDPGVVVAEPMGDDAEEGEGREGLLEGGPMEVKGPTGRAFGEPFDRHAPQGFSPVAQVVVHRSTS